MANTPKEPKDYVIATEKQITLEVHVNKFFILGITGGKEGINEKAKIIH